MKKEKHKYYLFSLHGIGASKDIFSHLGEALHSHWDLESELTYTPFDYRTGEDELTTADFANCFAQFVESFFAHHPLRQGDRISIIMHSQGGIIGLLWLEKLFYSRSHLLPFIDAFITMATPFWGSKVAEIGHEVRRIWDLTGRPFFLPTGKKELSEMSFVSDTIHYLRQLCICPKRQDFREYFTNKIRPLNIAAFSKMLGGLNHLVGEAGIYESDRAVSVPAARIDFYYYQSEGFDYSENDLIPLHELKLTFLAPFRLINAVHHSYAATNGPLAGIAQIPKDCVSNKDQHPAFPLVLDHLLHRNLLPPSMPLLHGLKFFILDINLRIEDGEKLDFNDIEITFTQLNGEKIKWSEITIGWLLLNRPDFKKRSVLNPNHLRFSFHGQIKNGADNYLFITKIEINNYRMRRLEVMVRPSYSTYLDITLGKK